MVVALGDLLCVLPLALPVGWASAAMGAVALPLCAAGESAAAASGAGASPGLVALLELAVAADAGAALCVADAALGGLSDLLRAGSACGEQATAEDANMPVKVARMD